MLSELAEGWTATIYSATEIISQSYTLDRFNTVRIYKYVHLHEREVAVYKRQSKMMLGPRTLMRAWADREQREGASNCSSVLVGRLDNYKNS